MKYSLIALRHAAFLAALLLCAVSCQNESNHKTNTTKQKEIVPAWVQQNIDTESACKIIFCDNIKLIKVGNSYTATYTFSDCNLTYYKVDKHANGNDFGFASWGVQYFDDSCKLKEDLRSFMKLQMVKYIDSHFEIERPK